MTATYVWSWPLLTSTDGTAHNALHEHYVTHGVRQIVPVHPHEVGYATNDLGGLRFDQAVFDSHIDAPTGASYRLPGDISIYGVAPGYDGVVVPDFENVDPYKIMGPIESNLSDADSTVIRSMTFCRQSYAALRARCGAQLWGWDIVDRDEQPPDGTRKRALLADLDGTVIPLYLPGDPSKDADRINYHRNMIRWSIAERQKRPSLKVACAVWLYRQNGTTMLTPMEQVQVLQRATEHYPDALILFVRAFRRLDGTVVNEWQDVAAQKQWLDLALAMTGNA